MDEMKHEHTDNPDFKPDAYMVVHFAEALLPVKHPDQQGHAFGPYPTLQAVENAAQAWGCPCLKVTIATMFPPGVTATVNTNEQLEAQFIEGHGIEMWRHDDGVIKHPPMSEELLSRIMESTTEAMMREFDNVEELPTPEGSKAAIFIFDPAKGESLGDFIERKVRERRNRRDRNN